MKSDYVTKVFFTVVFMLLGVGMIGYFGFSCIIGETAPVISLLGITLFGLLPIWLSCYLGVNLCLTVWHKVQGLCRQDEPANHPCSALKKFAKTHEETEE